MAKSPLSPLARSASVVVGFSLAVAGLAACAGPGEGGEVSPAASASGDVGTGDAVPGDADVEVPDTPVGREVTWVLGAIDPATPVAAEDAAARLGAAASDAITGEELVAAFAQLASTGPWRVTSYDGTDTQALAAIADAGGQQLDLTVVLDGAGLIETLYFAPAYSRDAAQSWEEVREAVAALGGETTLVVFDVTDPADPREVFAAGAPAAAAPIGSVVKLYVLGAVTQAVADGTLGWDDTLVVTDEVRSLPSGRLQDEPNGTEVSVRDAAQAMIEISDNTATDLLIDAVGRDAVEAQLAAMGHSAPGLNLPLATTRELFWLGWGDDGAYRAAWRDGDEAARRALLADLPPGPPEIPAALTEVVWDDGVDWFATPADLAAAHAALAEQAATAAGQPLTEILSANPGILPQAAAAFDSLAFKGGSSAGELALTWRAADADGAWVVVLQARTPDAMELADVRPYVGVAEDALALLAAGDDPA